MLILVLLNNIHHLQLKRPLVYALDVVQGMKCQWLCSCCEACSQQNNNSSNYPKQYPSLCQVFHHLSHELSLSQDMQIKTAVFLWISLFIEYYGTTDQYKHNSTSQQLFFATIFDFAISCCFFSSLHFAITNCIAICL